MNLKKLEKISKALGDVNRLRILHHVATNGGIGHCAAIQGCLDLAQPSVSHHIKILTEAGLIEPEKEGRHYKYILDQELLNKYLETMAIQILPGSTSASQQLESKLPPEMPSPTVVPPKEVAPAPVSPDKPGPGKVTHG